MRVRSVLGSKWAAVAVVALTTTWLIFAEVPVTAVQSRTAVPRNPVDRARALAEAAGARLPYLPGEVLVKFRRGTTSSRRQRALSALRSRPALESVRWSGDVGWFRDASEPNAPVLARQLSEQPEVEFAQPNFIRRLPAMVGPYAVTGAQPAATAPRSIPNDPDFSSLQWNFALLNMPAAWAITPGGSPTVTVAVVDTGVTAADVDLSLPLWTGQRFETVSIPFRVSPDISSSRFAKPLDFSFSPSGSVLDFSGHGTHVASTLAEDANNSRSLTGMAYSVRIMPVKVCVGYWELMILRAVFSLPGFISENSGGCTDEDVSAGIRYAADSGAQVLNLSLAGAEPSPALRDAIVYAVSRGTFVAIAGGNDFLTGNPVQYPGAYAKDIDGAMSVAAIGKSQTRAYYSSTGSYIEVAAPGGSDRDGGGDDQGYIWQVTLYPPDQDPAAIRPRFDRYVEAGYEGSSMATPHVAGLAALLMSQGALTPRAVEAVIKSTALDLGTSGRDDAFGAGLLQPRLALRGLGIAR